MTEKQIPPLLKFNSFYLSNEKTTDAMIAVVSDLMKDHEDWNCKIDLKWDKLEIRSEETEKQVRDADLPPAKES